jgi:hypothetical protein
MRCRASVGVQTSRGGATSEPGTAFFVERGRTMIDKPEIDAKVEELGVHAANVQRDLISVWEFL